MKNVCIRCRTDSVELQPGLIRSEFYELMHRAEKLGWKCVDLDFGWHWAVEIYAGSDWKTVRCFPADAVRIVQEKEAAGIGSVGTDDLFIRIPEAGLAFEFNHEACIEVTGERANAFFRDEINRFKAMG